MKRIVCPVCQGIEFVKNPDGFLCKGCGISYSLSDVKGMMVEYEEGETSVVENKQLDNQASQKETLLNELRMIRSYIVNVKANSVDIDKYFMLDSKDKKSIEDYKAAEIQSLKTYTVKPITLDYLELHPEGNLAYTDFYNSKEIREGVFDIINQTKRKNEQQWADYINRFDLIEDIDISYKVEVKVIPNVLGKDKKYSDFSFDFITNSKKDIMNTIKERLTDYFATNAVFGKGKALDRTLLFEEKYIEQLIIKMSSIQNKKSLFGTKHVPLRTKELVFNDTFDIASKSNTDVEILNYVNDSIRIYGENIESVRKIFVATCDEIQAAKASFGKTYDLIPEERRNEKNILALMNILLNERATTIGEALNLLDTYDFRKNVMNNFNQLNAKINALGTIMIKEYEKMNSTLEHCSNTLQSVRKLAIANLVLNILK